MATRSPIRKRSGTPQRPTAPDARLRAIHANPVAALVKAGIITERQIVEYFCKQAMAAAARERAV